MLIVFSGNELSIGVILANWLIIEALGCIYPGRAIEKINDKRGAFALVSVLFSGALIVALFAARILKTMLGISIGEHIGLLPMVYASFLILLPVSLLHGALFTFGCRLYASGRSAAAAVAGKTYVDETLRSIVGGALATFILFPHLNTFAIAIGVALLNALAGLRLLIPVTDRGGSRRRRVAPFLLGSVAALAALALATGQADRLHRASIRLQWANHHVVHYRNSPYGNIVTLENQGQYMFFLDGIPELITPIPDRLFVEEFVHLPMLAHPDPRDILILRGGAGGMIDEALKHPSVRNVTYAEHDPAFLDVIRKFPTPLTESELSDPRVRVRFTDGRRLLAVSPRTYDLILVGVKAPSNLQSNRFFTREFFALADGRLNRDGILVLTVPGSLTFPSDELRNLNGVVFRTLESVFTHVRVIPGDHGNLYLASHSAAVEEMDLDGVLQSLADRRIRTEGVVPWYIENKLHDGWRQWFQDFIDGAAGDINRDFKPVGLFHYITHWNSLYAPAFASIYNRIGRIHPGSVPAVLLLSGGLLFLIRLRRRRAGGFGVPFSIVTTGFAGMVCGLIVIFMFQIAYGHVFSWIGLLVAAYMSGSAVGATLINRMLPRIRQTRRWFLTADLAIIGFCLLLPFLLQAIHASQAGRFAASLLQALFLCVSLVTGLLVGLQFPLANKLRRRDGDGIGHTAGLLYASDLMGGWLGGMAGAAAIIPVMGIHGACVVVAVLKLTGFAIVAAEAAASRRRQ